MIQRGMMVAALAALAAVPARAEVTEVRAPALDAPAACDEDALSDAALRRCEQAIARSAVRALRAARGECRTRGPLLRAMIADVFDPSGFGRAVITHWTRLPADERRAFDALADDVVGRGERNRAAAMICTPGATIAGAAAHGDGLVLVDLYRPDLDDCTQLIFSRDPARAGAWRYDGEFYCGVDIFVDNWRRALGGGDYAAAMARLRALTTPAGSPR